MTRVETCGRAAAGRGVGANRDNRPSNTRWSSLRSLRCLAPLRRCGMLRATPCSFDAQSMRRRILGEEEPSARCATSCLPRVVHARWHHGRIASLSVSSKFDSWESGAHTFHLRLLLALVWPLPRERGQLSADSKRLCGSFARELEVLASCEDGQSTVEAAVLLPTVMLIFAILLEPACLLYTRCVMHGAAAEGARIAATLYGEGTNACQEYILRRLRAVPEASPFHVGGSGDWTVSIDKGDKQVTVAISGHARPLPLLGVVAKAFGSSDATGVVLEVKVVEQVKADWIGGDYSAWQKVWG